MGPIREEGAVKAKLDLAGAFRSQARITNVEWEEGGQTAPTNGIPRANGVEGSRRASRLSPRGANLHSGFHLGQKLSSEATHETLTFG